MNRYFEIRNDAKLMIIRVKRADIHTYDSPKNCWTAVSNIWTRHFNPQTRYIRSKEEKHQMFLHLKEFYKNDPAAGKFFTNTETPDYFDHLS